jgi:hypothetical protein
MTEQTPHLPERTAHERHGQAMRLARHLIAQTLDFFARNEADMLAKIRSHLMDLVDAKPLLVHGQNLRSAHTLLGRHAQPFYRALQGALADEIANELAAALPEPAKASAHAAVSSRESKDPGLSLVDVQDVERVLLIDRVAQRFSGRYELAMEPLTQRLCVLFGHQGGSVVDNPFHPVVLIRSLASAWEGCALDAQATDDFLLSLTPDNFADLAVLYEALNATLEKAGIQAQRPLTIRRNAHEPGSAFATISSALEQGEGSRPAPFDASPPGGSAFTPLESATRSAWATLAPAAHTVAAHARHFLQRLGLAGGAPGESATPDPALMGYLGDLQAQACGPDGSPVVDGQDFSDPNVLRQMRDADEFRSAPELDRGTLDALAEVFDFVFADQSIPKEMKIIIGRLQIPILKAAMIDRDFFLSDQHPARRLVDTLAGASVTWAPEKGESDPLYVRIESTVQRVLTEFEDDLELFVDLLRDFTEFLFESEQQASARAAPTEAFEKNGESRELALSQADELIHQHLRALNPEYPLAPFLVPFLTFQWRDVIAHNLQRGGDSQAACGLAVSTMDRLIWSTQPKTTSEQRRELVAVLPELVRQLNLELDAMDWAGEPRATFTRRLIATHTMAIRLKQAAVTDTRAAAIESLEGKAALQQLQERRAARQVSDQDDFDAVVQGFRRGLWFDVEVEPGTRGRCRLSWVSPMRTRLLFTNREGFEAFVRSEREVAAMLRMGRLRVLDQEPIIGRALGQILQGQEPATAG